MANITFYGTRGSFPLSSEKYMEYGGATTCVLLRFSSATIMVDCGTGANVAIDDLSDVDELHLFISHFHSDHTNGIVTLLPAFSKKKLHIYAKSFNGTDIRENIDRVMSQPLWPVSYRDFPGIEFHELDDVIKIGDVTVRNMDSNHPGGCSLYRFDDPDTSIVTAFDFCHLDGYAEKLIEFAKGCKILLYDGNMNAAEFAKNPTWGHSTPETGAEIAKKIGVESLYITHHGMKSDDELSQWEDQLHEQYPFLQFARSGMRKSELIKMIQIGTMLTTEHDNDRLLWQLVEATMDITGADGGTLYLLENDQLEFKVVINKSKSTKELRKTNPIGWPPVKLEAKNISAAAARDKILINIEDCYRDERYDFSGVHKYDEMNHYRTKSVLAVPMSDDDGDVIGVLQLINATDKVGNVVPFRKQDDAIVQAIANQAAMTILNVTYSQQISDLLYGFVKVMSLGIDERTPYNVNHTRNMVAFAEKFFDYEEKNEGPYKVDPDKRREIIISIWLHDIGKILTPLYIMNKDSRLGDSFAVVSERFSRRDLLLQLARAKGEISEDEYNRLQDERKNQFALINKINCAGFLSDDMQAELDNLEHQEYKELDGSICPVITENEYTSLSIKKGTLTAEERSIMEGHVVLTQKFLSQLDFPKDYECVPLYAGSHHEFLNGTGYPNHLTAEDLPWPCRLITVLDIFDALMAKDRPYKKQMPVEKAFAILGEMADEGKLDRDIIAEYTRSKAWEL